MKVIRGKGIKDLDDIYEYASLKVLIRNYGDRIHIQKESDVFTILYSFEVYICSEYQEIYLKNKEVSKHIDVYNSVIKNTDGTVLYPSYILNDIERIDSEKSKDKKEVSEEPSSRCCLWFRNKKN